jgi:hypothetical protein
MSLRKDAIELSRVLSEIVASASNRRSGSIAELARSVAENVAKYDRAVFEKRSRVEASDALADFAEVVSALSAASTKSELDLFEGELLSRYWRLHTIFREARYRDQSL